MAIWLLENIKIYSSNIFKNPLLLAMENKKIFGYAGTKKREAHFSMSPALVCLFVNRKEQLR